MRVEKEQIFPASKDHAAKGGEERISFHLIWGFRPGFVYMAITFNFRFLKIYFT